MTSFLKTEQLTDTSERIAGRKDGDGRGFACESMNTMNVTSRVLIKTANAMSMM